MHEKTYFLPAFLISVAIILIFTIGGFFGFFGFLTNTLQSAFFPFSGFFQNQLTQQSVSTLKKENLSLSEKLVSLQQIQADNKALRDQFQTPNPVSRSLLPFRVVGMDSEALTINGGQKDGLSQGSIVVVGQELIGTVSKTTAHFAEVSLVTSKKSSFSATTSTSGAIGVVKGQGNGQLLIDNVLLADTLTVGDFVVTLGNQNDSGKGLPPGLIVGKIRSVEKNPSNLFQRATLSPLLAFDHLSTVFVIKPE